ncbi:MAG TPA: helix-turn-helix transcriptional regulator [Solirubrobacterales bacterium]|nr:helix-turn-helix transcriptional regulator [Solirubrobacterales bacterium]
MNVAEQFGANLVRLRRRAGLSQEQTAIRATLHRTEIGLLERGHRLARVDTVAKLAGALEVDPGDFFDGIEWLPGAPHPGGRFTEGSRRWPPAAR